MRWKGMLGGPQHRQRRRSARVSRRIQVREKKGLGYHVESLVCVFLCRLTASAIDPNAFAIVHRCLEDPVNGRVQVIVERTQDRTADVVAQIPGTDEQDVNAGDPGDFLDLCLVQH